MGRPVSNLLRIASALSRSHPILAYDLERSTLNMIRDDRVQDVSTWEEALSGHVDRISSVQADTAVIRKELDPVVRLMDRGAVIAARIASFGKTAGQDGRPDFTLELKPEQKLTSHPSDKIFITYYNGWSWTHINVDGFGGHDTTLSDVTPERMIEMIDEFIVPNEAAMEAREYFEGLVEAGETEGGVDIPPGPSALPSPEEVMREKWPSSPFRRKEKFVSDYNPTFFSTRLCSLLINVAYARPELRARILPIVAKYAPGK